MNGFRHTSGRIKRKNIQIVVTEGLSEEIYLDRIRSMFEGVPIHTVNAGGGDIGKLKRECSKILLERERWDMLAIVTDMDEKSVSEIIKFDDWCKRNGVELYLSNPSFEVFLLMHYQDVRGSMSQSDLEEALGRHLGRRYDKAKGIRPTERSVAEAIRTAEHSLPKNIDPIAGVARFGGTTNFHKLLGKITDSLKQ